MAQKIETVYLIDGNSFIYRAYHAIKHLSNSKGVPTNAVFGFTKMLLKLLDEKSPRYGAVALDSKEPTFRHEIYDQYKATRPPMPEELVIQLPYIKAVIQALNISVIEQPGYEADDIIGTLVRIGEEQGYDIVVVTGDKDFRQIISRHTSLWDTMSGKFIDYESFVEEYKLQPHQIIDLMGLSGDSSDNIPGVRGIGEKTAGDLIRKFGSLENVFFHMEEITKKKLKENLERSQADAIISKKLVAIDKNVPLNKDIKDLKLGKPDNENLTNLFHELEFKGLWEQFAISKEVLEKDYRLCLSDEELHSLIEKIKKRDLLSFDTETTSEDPHRAELVGISFSFEEGKAYYIPFGHMYIGAPKQLNRSTALERLKPVFEDERIKKIGQNIKYDAQVLKHYGVSLKGIFFDTMIASYVINPGLRQHNLDYLAQHYLSHKMIKYHDVVGKGKSEINFSGVNIESAMEYSCEDADITLRLVPILEDLIKEEMNQELFHNLEMKLLPVLMEMELSGILIDTDFFNIMSKRFAGQIREIQEEIFKEAGMEFNINSPKQLGFVLFEKLRLPTQKKTTKNKSYSTDVKVLKKLALSDFLIPKLLLQYRTLSKIKSTYLDALVKIVNPSTGRIHTSFNQTVAATGRLSSSNPNLQNIPIRGQEGKEIRKGFIADSGCFLLSSDYSQVELRVFAHYSGDKAMLDAFRKGEDIHSRTASEILGVPMDEITEDMRRMAKAINFGIIYGMGSRKLSEELGIDLKQAGEYIKAYFKRYEGVARYKDKMTKMARDRGYVTTLFNRRRYIPEIGSENNRTRAEAERIAVNTPIQGTAADLIKKAMINIYERLKSEGFKTRMLLQVHDELLFEVPEHEIDGVLPVIRKEMEEVHKLDVPLKVDINYGKNWGEAH